MTPEQIAFLHSVREATRGNPGMAAHVVAAAYAGVDEALRETRERAADMEALAAIALTRKYPKQVDAIKAKLKKWEGKTSLKWEDV